MVLTFILIAIVLLVVILMIHSESSNMSVGAVVIGVVLAFLLLATPAGPYVQEFMNFLGTESQDLVVKGWDHLTT